MIAVENIFDIDRPDSWYKVFKYLFAASKEILSEDAKKATPSQPDCNEFASRFPEFQPTNANKAACAKQLSKWTDWMAGTDYAFDRSAI